MECWLNNLRILNHFWYRFVSVASLKRVRFVVDSLWHMEFDICRECFKLVRPWCIKGWSVKNHRNNAEMVPSTIVDRDWGGWIGTRSSSRERRGNNAFMRYQYFLSRAPKDFFFKSYSFVTYFTLHQIIAFLPALMQIWLLLLYERVTSYNW